MFNLKSTFVNAVCALALAMSSLAANAGVIPAYHVTVNTNAFAGQTGFLDVAFSSFGAGATATLSNFSTGFGAVDPFSSGYTQPTAGTFSLLNTANAYLSQNVNLGGVLSFDVAFAGDFTSVMGTFASDFVVYLFDPNLNSLVGTDGKVVGLQVNQLSNLGAANVVFTPVSTLGNANAIDAVAVPEPADWLLMLTGLVFVVYMTRLNGRTTARRLAAA